MRWSLPRNFRSRQTLPRELVHKENQAIRHFVRVHPLGWKRYQVCAWCFKSRQMAGPWDQRDTVAVEPPLCLSTCQELAEPERLEANVAFASIWHIRAVREMKSSSIAANRATLAHGALTVCSTLVILEGDNTHGLTNGFDLFVEICKSSCEW